MQTARKVGAIAVVVVIIGVAWWQVGQLKSRASSTGSESSATGLTVFRGNAGVALPPIKGKTLDGEMLSLADLRGHVVVLNVWGSWCAPCRAEAPDLAKVSAETAPRGVRFVGIDVRDNLASARAFVRNYGITYPSFDDQDGLVLGGFTGIIPVSAVPSTLVVDKAGVIRARVVGRVDGATLRGLIEDAEAIR